MIAGAGITSRQVTLRTMRSPLPVVPLDGTFSDVEMPFVFCRRH